MLIVRTYVSCKALCMSSEWLKLCSGGTVLYRLLIEVVLVHGYVQENNQSSYKALNSKLPEVVDTLILGKGETGWRRLKQ